MSTTSGFAASLRTRLFFQAAVTAIFGLLRPGSGAWMLLTFAIAFAAVGVGASLKADPRARVAVLVFEAIAVAFGVVSLLGAHYVPGTIIAVSVLIQVARTPASAFGETASVPPAFTQPEYAGQAAFVPPQPLAGLAGAWAPPADLVSAPTAYPPPVPVSPPAAYAPPLPAVLPPPSAPFAPPAADALAAAPVLAVPAAAPLPPVEPSPPTPPAPALPATAAACLTILPQ